MTSVGASLALLLGCGPDGPAAPNVRSKVNAHGETEYFLDCGQPLPGDAACLIGASSNASGVVTALSSPAGTGWWGAADIQHAYSAVISGGAGTTVAVVSSFDNPNAESDLAAYRSYYGLVPCTTANGCFHKWNQYGNTSPLPPPASDLPHSLEIDADVEMVSATCPNCNILLIETNSASIADHMVAEGTATEFASFISNSWGFPESSAYLGYESIFNTPGVSIFASSGDSAQLPLYPSTSAYVTGVGGTTLFVTSNARGWSEKVWPNTGSGCSAIIAKPYWQTDHGCSTRTATDVSAVATNVAFYDTFLAGGWVTGSGTSIASPIVAGLYAATANYGAGPSYSYPSTNFAAYNDVTIGSNGTCGATNPYLCNGEVGYDAPTGNGTPNAGNLMRYNTYFADVTGDHRADGIALDTPTVWELSSTGSGFGSPAEWNAGTLRGQAATAVGDVNHDGKADIVEFNPGSIYVALSNGNGFNNPALWGSYSFWGQYGTALGDVNGDGYADGVAFTGAGVYVVLSTGSGFSRPAHWLSTMFAGSHTTQVADVNGDGRADLIAVNSNGLVVSLSTGTSFGPPTAWLGAAFYGSYATLFADIDGDRRADAVAFDGGGIWVTLSTGSAFGPIRQWFYNGSPIFGGTHLTALADVNGDGLADAIADNTNNIYVALSNGGSFGIPSIWLNGSFYGIGD